MDRGELGQIWRLEVGSAAYAVKEPFAPIDEVSLQLAADLQERAAAYGVRAPRQLRTRDGRSTIRVDAVPVRVYGWVELAGPDRGLDPAAVGAMLAALHRAGGPTQGEVPSWYADPVGDQRWTELVGDLERSGAPFAAAMRSLGSELARSESILRRPGPELIVAHRDLWADNVRAGPDGSVVVIDWDNSGPVEPVQELAMVLVEFGTTAHRARTLHDAYVRLGGPATLTAVSDFTLPLAVLHHLLERAAQTWLAAPDDAGRRRAERSVAEFVLDPVTVAVAEQLLLAVRGACRGAGR